MQLPKSTVLIVTSIGESALTLPFVPLVHSISSVFPVLTVLVVKVQPVQVSSEIVPVGFTVALPALVSSPLTVEPVHLSSVLPDVSTKFAPPPDGMLKSSLEPRPSGVVPL